MMLHWGIRNRLIVSILLLIVISLLSLGSYVLWYFHRYTMESLTNNLRMNAQVTENLLREHMSGPIAKSGIDEIIKELGTKVENIRITIIDNSGVVLADSQENPAVMENHLQRPEILPALSGNTGTAIRYSTTLGENMLYVAIPMVQNSEITGVVRVATDLAHVEAGFNKIISVLLTAFFITSLLAIILGIRLAKSYIAPLEEITVAAQKIADGQLDTRIYIRTGDEIELLAHTLNNLTSNLEDKVNEIVAEKNKLELILQHMDNAVILLDRYGRVITVNRLAAETFNITKDMLGQHNIQVVGNSLLDKAARQTIETRQSRVIDLKTNFGSNKRVFQVFLSSITGHEDNITGVLTVFHDITALQAIHERQSEFVANASHELATPLTAIKGFTETLLEGAISDPAASLKFLRIIHAEAERMHRLVKDLLQLARLNAQEYRQGIPLEPTSIGPILESVVQEMAPEWSKKELHVKIDHYSRPVVLMANTDCLKQVVVNLLDNSIKYTPLGGTIHLTYYQDSSSGVLTIKDSGLGIPSKDLPLIFDRFYRVDRARARSAGGTGLGLSIVKFIIDSLGGKIQVQSELDAGTTFTITLPLADK